MNNEENNLNNGNVQNTFDNSNPEILESTPVEELQPTTPVSNSNEILTPEEPSVEQTNTVESNVGDNSVEQASPEQEPPEQTPNDGAARIETETGGEGHIHLDAYQHHEKKEKKAIVRTAEEEKGYSRRRVGMLIFFILLIAFVIFLPNLRDLYIQYKTHVEEEEISSGKLICTLDRSTDDFDITYNETFSFKKYKLQSFNYSVETKGDASKDIGKFKEIYGKCDNLSKTVGINNLTGIVIDCSYVEGDDKVVETQTFDYNTIDKGELKSAYTEAGVEYPEFELDDNINEIEKSMLAGGFTCQKVS